MKCLKHQLCRTQLHTGAQPHITVTNAAGATIIIPIAGHRPTLPSTCKYLPRRVRRQVYHAYHEARRAELQ